LQFKIKAQAKKWQDHLGKGTEYILTSTCQDGNCCHDKPKCKHGGTGMTECTSCLADKSLLLEDN